MRLLEFINHILISQSDTVCNPANVTDKLCNPLERALHVHDLPTLVGIVMNSLSGVLGLMAIALVVYAGFRMVTANGDKTQIDKAKEILKYSIYGFVAAILAYAVVVAIENFIGVQDVNYNSYGPQNPLLYPNFKVFVEQMIKNVLLIVGFVSILMIIINGYRYMTARGNETQVEDARRALTWAIAGLAVSLFAYTIISALAKLIS